MEQVNSRKRAMTGLALGLGLAGLVSAGTMPLETHAAEKKGISDATVTVGKDGTITYAGELANGADGTAWTKLIEKYRFFIAGISGVGAVSMILFFIINFVKLGGTSSNPQERSKAISGLIFSGLAAAGLGAVTFIVGIFYNAL